MDIKDVKLKTSDKIVGGVLAAVLGGGLIYALTIIVPILLTLVVNTVYLGIMICAAAFLAMVVWDSWRDVFYWWKNQSRKIRRKIVADDPIGTLTTALERMRNKLEDINESYVRADAAGRRQRGTIAEMMRHADEEDDLARTAHRMNRKADVAVHAEMAAGWRAQIAELTPMADDFDKMKQALLNAKEMAERGIVKIEARKKMLSMKLETMKEGQATVKAFRRFFSSNPDLEMHQMAVDEIELQTSTAVSDIDDFLRTIDPQIKREQLARQMDQDRAIDAFNAKFLNAAKTEPALQASTIDAELIPRK